MAWYRMNMHGFGGMLLSDGWISTQKGIPRSIQWHQRFDSYTMLESLRFMVNSSSPIIFGSTTCHSRIFPTSRLTLRSLELSSRAQIILGCETNRKTFDLEFPSDIDDIFLPSLVRGIFDGDGSWGFQRNGGYPFIDFRIASANVNFLSAIERIINQQALHTTKVKKRIYKMNNQNCHQLAYRTQREVIQIGNWMYQHHDLKNHDLFMKQKYARFKLIKTILEYKPSEKLAMINAFAEQEKIDRDELLKKLILLSTEADDSQNCPSHFRFAKSFDRITKS